MAGESIGLDYTTSEQTTVPITNSPIVKLVHPPDPEDCLRIMAIMWLNAHHVDPIRVVDGKKMYYTSTLDHEQCVTYEDVLELEKIQEMIWKEVIPMPAWHTVLECVRFTFVIYNLSRPAQQQLTRQRYGVGFNNNSLRIIKLETFADEGRYRIPPRLIGTDLESEFRVSMYEVQENYKTLLGCNVKQEDARGVMPQNIHSPTCVMFADYRALLGFIPKRLCYEAQDEMNEFAVSLKREIDEWDHWFGNTLSFPCSRDKECVVGPKAAADCKLPYEWKGGTTKGLIITSHKEE